MVISISGVGFSGAGAYYDLLCELENVEHTPNLYELGILYETDGLIDLVNKLKYNSCKITSYVPIRRFLHLAKFYNDYGSRINNKIYSIALEFINGLDPIYTKGYQYHEIANQTIKEKICNRINTMFLSRLNKIYKTNYSFKLDREMIICLDVDNIEKSAKDFVENVLNSFRNDINKDLLIKHICPPDIPEICLPYLPEDFRQISVNRDPRDLYILGKLYNTSDFPCCNVKDFVRYYLAIRLRQKTALHIKYVNFEDLCYKYEETVRDIINFVSVKSFWKKGSYFNPEHSIQNTKLFLKYSQYEEDITYIEKTIPQYLYNY